MKEKIFYVITKTVVFAAIIMTFSMPTKEVKAGIGSYTNVSDSGAGSNLEWMLNTATKTLTIRLKTPGGDNASNSLRDYNSSDFWEQPWYSYRSQIEHVELSNGIRKIGDFIFLIAQLRK